MGHQPSRNYGRSTKLGVSLGAGLFLIGVLGQLAATHLQGALPNWERSLFIWFMMGGIVLALLSVFVLGLALPLME